MTFFYFNATLYAILLSNYESVRSIISCGAHVGGGAEAWACGFLFARYLDLFLLHFGPRTILSLAKPNMNYVPSPCLYTHDCD